MHDDVSNAQRWSMLVCSMIAAMTTTCVVSGVPYLIPTLHTDEGLSLTTASVVATVPTIGLMIGIIPWGVLLDRYGERLVLMVSLSGTLVAAVAAAAAALGDAPTAALSACLFLGGVASGAANGASGRIVVGWFPAHRRGTAMGFRQMAQPLGMGLCALTMPIIAAAHGVGAALLVPVAVTAVGLACCVFGIQDPPSTTESAGPSRPDTTPATPDNPYRTSNFLARVHALSVALVIPQSMLWTFVPTWLIVNRGWAPAAAGTLITATQITGALGRIGAGKLSDVMGSRMRPISLIAITAGTATGALAVLDAVNSPVAVAIMVIASIASVADNGLAFTAIAEYAGPRWSGRSLGIQNTAQHLATAATTPLLGSAVSHLGFAAAFGLTALAPLIALPLIPRDAT